MSLKTDHEQPVPKEELPMLRQLQEHRKRLVQAKKNHEIKTLEDLNAYSMDIDKIMNDLRLVREKEDGAEAQARNRLDKILDDIWLILFQIWTSIGSVSESLYQVYAELCGILSSLEMLKSRSIYDYDMINPLQERARYIETRYSENGRWFDPNTPREKQPGVMIPNGQAVLSIVINRIYRLAHEMLVVREHISPDLVPIIKQLENLSQRISKLEESTDGHIEVSAITSIQQELDAIEATKVRGAFWGTGGAKEGVDPPPGQAVLRHLVEKLYERLRVLLLSQDQVEDALYPVYEAILAVRRDVDIMMKESDRGGLAKLSEVKKLVDSMQDLEKLYLHDGVWKSSRTLPTQPLNRRTQALLHLLAAQVHHRLFVLALRIEPIDAEIAQLAEDLGMIWVKLRDLETHRSSFHAETECEAESVPPITGAHPLVTADDLKSLETELGRVNACRDEDGNYWPPQLSGVEIRENLLKNEAPPKGQLALHQLAQECRSRLYALK